MPFILGGLAIGSAVMGGMGQAAQAAQQAAQADWAEFTKKMDIARKNRNIHRQNAAKWMQNILLEKSATKSKHERDFYIKRNYENTTGEFSRNVQATNEKLLGFLHGKNLKGQTAKQIMRQAMGSAEKAAIGMRINKENALRSSERKRDSILSRRDFGYNSHIAYMPGPPVQDMSSSIMTNAIIGGIMQGGMTVAGGFAQEAADTRMIEAIKGTP